MSTQIKVTSTRRKTKSVSKYQPIKLTPGMIEDHALKQAYKEWHDFMGNHTEAEMKVVAHVTPLTYASMIDVMKEIRRLLGESAVKCKIFQFPVVNKRRTI